MHLRRLPRFGFWLLVGLSLWLCLGFASVQPSRSIASEPPSLTQQGIDQYQAGQFQPAIVLWQQALAQTSDLQQQAAIHNNLALAYRQTGDLPSAIAHWQQAIDYQQNKAASGEISKLQIEQAQAYSRLGQHQRAIDLARSVVQQTQANPLAQAAAFGSLGNALLAQGNSDLALEAQQHSLSLAQQLQNPQYITTALNNLGTIHLSRAARSQFEADVADKEGDSAEQKRLTQQAAQQRTAARSTFEQAVQTSQALGGVAQAQALLNLTRLLSQSAPPDQVAIARNQSALQQILPALPASRDKAYLLINLATGLPGRGQEAALKLALETAQAVNDRRAESFALGSLGEFYQTTQQSTIALATFQQAQLAAQQVNAAESLYRWQWQTGRLLKALHQDQPALVSYQQAIATLQSIRGDLLAANTDVQFDFRDSVEPVYRETMQLLLEPQKPDLKQVLDTLELLKLAELQNYFGNDCVQVAQARARKSGDDATVVYSLALDDRTEMIVRSPTGQLTHHTVALDRRSLQQTVDTFRQLLEKRSTDEYLVLSQKLYTDLIRPLEPDLVAAKTLVFIQDGVLRQVPMVALHDGQQFLIQKYPIATTPSLSLTAGTVAQPPYSKALILGLTVERPPFAALPNVRGEVAAVKTILGGTELVDRAFTLSNLESQLEKNYPVVHVATHGKLGVNSSNSFLQAFDQRITLEQIDTILRSRRTDRQAVELLTLSACQTAAGDDRAALGFAGIAVRAGVKSAIASLWYINDEATAQLIQEFYTQLQRPNVTKAEALQAAQIKLIGNFQYNHPAVWSPFVLIGNWL